MVRSSGLATTIVLVLSPSLDRIDAMLHANFDEGLGLLSVSLIGTGGAPILVSVVGSTTGHEDRRLSGIDGTLNIE